MESTEIVIQRLEGMKKFKVMYQKDNDSSY